MSLTTTRTTTLKDALNEANPNEIADALNKINMGTMFTVNRETITIASATTLNLLTQSTAKVAAQYVQSVRVVTGTATGVRIVGDAGATPSTTVVALSADGTTLTFEAAVTVVAVVWAAKPATDLTSIFIP
jgi:hypothetical protein